MTKYGLRTKPWALFWTLCVHYKLWLVLPLVIHASIVPLILQLDFECKCPYFLFVERKIIPIHIPTNAASFVFLQNKGHIGFLRLAISKIVTVPLKIVIVVVRTVASRSTCISKPKRRKTTGTFQHGKPLLLFNMILKMIKYRRLTTTSFLFLTLWIIQLFYL